MAKKFPKALFVKIEKDTSGPSEYFIADSEIDGMVEMGSKTRIAIYRLESTVDCEGVIKTTSVPRRRR